MTYSPEPTGTTVRDAGARSRPVVGASRSTPTPPAVRGTTCDWTSGTVTTRRAREPVHGRVGVQAGPGDDDVTGGERVDVLGGGEGADTLLGGAGTYS